MIYDALALIPCKTPEGAIVLQDSATMDKHSFVFCVKYGRTYEIHFPETLKQLIVVSIDFDPRNLPVGRKILAKEIRWVVGTPTIADLGGLLYTPRNKCEFLVIYTGTGDNMLPHIEEHVILAENDTPGLWYKPSRTGGFLGNADSFGNYAWSSDEIYENLYEPLRMRYPAYVKREFIGKDQSGSYDMFCYIFEPENYEQSVFLSAGMHANEEDAYIALAYFMGEIANEDGTNSQLRHLHEKVRFIVIPLINVWGVNQIHSVTEPNWQIRCNSTGTDLNRDFAEQTQQETKNVVDVLRKYGDSIAFGIDFHTTPVNNGSDLFFNFPISAENMVVNFKVVNHTYHRMVEEGMITDKRPLLIPSDISYGNLAAIDGKYPSHRTLQAYLWNIHKIPPLTVEYMNFTSGKSPSKGSCEGLSMAVENFGNFIIQNALFYTK